MDKLDLIKEKLIEMDQECKKHIYNCKGCKVLEICNNLYNTPKTILENIEYLEKLGEAEE